MSVPSRTVRLKGDGIMLAATAYGHEENPPVVLLHGGGQTRHAWGKAGETLAAAGRYALSVDLRGHGDSDWSPDGSYEIGSLAADVRCLARTLSRPPVLVGASLGGLSSLVAIGETTEHIADALVLVDVAPHLESAGVDSIRAFMSQGLNGFDELEHAADAIAQFLPHRPRPKSLDGLRKNLRRHADGRWYWHWDPRFMENREGIDGQAGQLDRERYSRAAAGVRVPTLLVRGRMSDVVSDESVRHLEEVIPHAEVVDVTDASHMVAGDRNDAFNTAVIDFIDRIAPL